MELFKFFKKIGLKQKDWEVFFALYKLWTQPASVVSKHLNLERTLVYKTLINLTKENLVSETQKNWIKNFFITDVSILKKYVKNKIKYFEELNSNLDLVEIELKRVNQNMKSQIPKISIFDWINWIKNLFEDIFEVVDKNNYISIKLFASNTLDSQMSWVKKLNDFWDDLFNNLKNKKVSVETFIWNWMEIMENINVKTEINLENLKNLPAWNSSINIFVVGQIVYLVIFKESPFWIKIESEDFAQSMHFILDNLKK